jgi:HEAT repeat protein
MLFSFRRNEKTVALPERDDVSALVDAVEHTELGTRRDGRTVDLGAPIREAAILRLVEIGHRDAAPAVTRALADPSDRVRCAAIRVLCEWREPMPLAEAVSWLPAEGASRALALAAISRLSEPESAAVLASSLIHGTAQAGLWEEEAAVVLSLCRTARGQRPLDRVLDVLVEALEDEDEAVAGRAEDFLLWLGEAAAPAVTAAVQHSSAPHSCVWILGQIGGLVALDPLMQALDHSNARTRAEACVGLGKLRDPISLQPLLRATRDPEHIVRVRAADALDRFGTVAVIAALSAPLSPGTRETLPNADNPPAVGSTKSQRRRARPAQNGSSPRAKNGSSPRAKSAFPPRP